MTKVADVMSPGVVSIRSDATLREALTYLATQHLSGVPVVDRKHRLVGAITRSDLLEAEVELSNPEGPIRFLDDIAVADVMTTPALTIAPDAELKEAALTMEFADVHRLFVEVQGEVVGVVSRSDVSRALATGRV